MRFIYFGSSYFSQVLLNALCVHKLKPLLIVSQPDKPKGRGLRFHPTKVSIFAEQNKIRLIKPLFLNDQDVHETLLNANADFLVVADYGKIIPSSLLELPGIFPLCVHPSLLPAYRGPTPIENAILYGDKETGVTIFKINEMVDAGSIILQEKIAINSQDDFFSLREKLLQVSASALIRTMIKINNNDYCLLPQDEQLSTKTCKFCKQDGKINWDKPAGELLNLIRAFSNWPIAYTYYHGIKVQLLAADLQKDIYNQKCGQIVQINKQGIMVVASEGLLLIKEVRPEGKGKMDAYSFSCGYRVKEGDYFE